MTLARAILVFYPHNYVQAASGTHARFLQLARYFQSRGFKADLISFDGFTNGWDDDSLEAARQFFRSVTTVQWHDTLWRQAVQRMRGPRRLQDLTIPPLRAAWRHAVSRGHYSHALVSYAYWSSLLDGTPKPVTTVIDLHDCLTIHHMRREGQHFYGYGRMLEDECRAISRFDHALSISQSERGLLESLCDRVSFHDVPMAFAPIPRRSQQVAYDLLFVGSDNPFNCAGLTWFFNDVLPRVRTSSRVAIAGRVCDAVPIPTHVRAFGHVADLDPIYAATRLVVCPLLGGTGMKIKVIDALFHGVPVITTRWGVDGVIPGFSECCVVADSASAFASAIDGCLEQPERINDMAAAAREYALQNYSEEAVSRRLDEVFDSGRQSAGTPAGR